MQCQLIQNFLDLPGIIGFSLMPLEQDDASGNIYSVGFAQGDGPDQHPLLLPGVQQIIKTMPASLEFCAFQFGTYQVELHKVESEAALLIFTESPLPDQYSKSVSELMQFIKADYPAFVEGMQWMFAENSARVSTVSHHLQAANVDDVLAAMNSLSQITSRYLGTQLVANHWRTYQPPNGIWIDRFRVSIDGTISVTGMEQRISPEQLAEIRLWAQRFHQRCTRIIRDYDALVEQTLPEQYWRLLFGG